MKDFCIFKDIKVDDNKNVQTPEIKYFNNFSELSKPKGLVLSTKIQDYDRL